MTTAMIGMGANLSDPVQQILDARALLLALQSTVSGRCSSLYWSSPVGFTEQANFINCVIQLQTELTPQTLLENMQVIETSLGRQREAGNQNAPRMIDLDLLLFGDQAIETEQLVVPHPRMHERLFVLAPLHELQPDLCLAGYGPISDLIDCLSASSDQVLHRLSA